MSKYNSEDYGPRPSAYPETHQQGTIMFENIELLEVHEGGVIRGDLGVQIADDGRVWVCINGIAFLRFSPHPNGAMAK